MAAATTAKIGTGNFLGPKDHQSSQDARSRESEDDSESRGGGEQHQVLGAFSSSISLEALKVLKEAVEGPKGGQAIKAILSITVNIESKKEARQEQDQWRGKDEHKGGGELRRGQREQQVQRQSQLLLQDPRQDNQMRHSAVNRYLVGNSSSPR